MLAGLTGAEQLWPHVVESRTMTRPWRAAQRAKGQGTGVESRRADESTTASRPPGFHDFWATTASGERLSMSEYRGQVVLVVNTATQCSFTPQLRGLQTLQDAFGPLGFTVLGFPSDQFHQNPESDERTEELCTSEYQVTFPVFSTIDVNGPTAHPLWQWLRERKGGVLGGRIAWNFTKFLVSADGEVLRRYAPPVPPVRVARQIEQELGLEPGTTPLD